MDNIRRRVCMTLSCMIIWEFDAGLLALLYFTFFAFLHCCYSLPHCCCPLHDGLPPLHAMIDDLML